MLYIYDDTFDGLMSAIFLIYENRDRDAEILPASSGGTSLFDTVQVATSTEKAARVEKKLSALDPESYPRLYTAWLSHSEGVENLILACVRLAIKHGAGAFSLKQLDCVTKLDGIAKKVGHDAHRMLQFVRFIRLGENIFAADIEPDYDIISLIGDHFHSRFRDSGFFIRDVRHMRVLVSLPDGGAGGQPGGWYITELEPGYRPLPEDGDIEEMWQLYFKTIAIEQRINPKLQQNFVPKKYRRFLTEFRQSTRKSDADSDKPQDIAIVQRPILPE